MCREMQVQIECARKKINILLKKCECNNKILYNTIDFTLKDGFIGSMNKTG